MWVKRHTRIEGNEKADSPASQGAMKDNPDEIDTTIDHGRLIKEAELSSLTQVLASKGIRDRKEVPERRTTTETLWKVKEHFLEQQEDLYSERAIWKLTQNPGNR